MHAQGLAANTFDGKKRRGLPGWYGLAPRSVGPRDRREPRRQAWEAEAQQHRMGSAHGGWACTAVTGRAAG
ncbi:hypothetical protein E2562_025500 [Oryza meyeriana var. granulata]|uniref:Uncharacterized protein n=1 Tax=Oryza meyeriana var. granulata TaxID=110450 RepID=A0A6G1CHG6_9ORYZ|nr:hypothetical protein E2562_025498 [Oryza meyeriana var. granulata]KAF0899940.1 hypothetical protein E2562_025500 [Oryza meyeriana var. granulata]